MNTERLNSLACRLGFFGAFFVAALAVLERVINEFGYTILRGSYAPGRLLEFAGILLIFVVALLLRQVRELLREKGT